MTEKILVLSNTLNNKDFLILCRDGYRKVLEVYRVNFTPYYDFAGIANSLKFIIDADQCSRLYSFIGYDLNPYKLNLIGGLKKHSKLDKGDNSKNTKKYFLTFDQLASWIRYSIQNTQIED